MWNPQIFRKENTTGFLCLQFSAFSIFDYMSVTSDATAACKVGNSRISAAVPGRIRTVSGDHILICTNMYGIIISY